MADLERLRQQAAGDRERHERQLEEDERQRLTELAAEVARLGEPPRHCTISTGSSSRSRTSLPATSSAPVPPSDRACLARSTSCVAELKAAGTATSSTGVGFVGAVRANGADLAGKRALQIGAGGAGSAIAMALVEAGVRTLAIHDTDVARRDQLIAKLKSLGRGEIDVGTADPTGFDLVANATPLGMKAGDPLPVDVSKLKPGTFVGCVITSPAISPLIEAARRQECPTSTGTDMYNALQNSMLDFLFAADGSK